MAQLHREVTVEAIRNGVLVEEKGGKTYRESFPEVVDELAEEAKNAWFYADNASGRYRISICLEQVNS